MKDFKPEDYQNMTPEQIEGMKQRFAQYASEGKFGGNFSEDDIK